MDVTIILLFKFILSDHPGPAVMCTAKLSMKNVALMTTDLLAKLTVQKRR